MTFDIQLAVRVGIRRNDDLGHYLGWCPELNVFSQGETEEEAFVATVDAAQLFAKHCCLRGQIMKAFQSAGYTLVDAPPDGGLEPLDPRLGAYTVVRNAVIQIQISLQSKLHQAA